mmetsp:Transcript_18923/g.28791  ORF Transcript_18923/g.28791 Transcript_18923/m.28791 type:complete len:260 (-) Transcript_18923:21-800(-)
MMATENYRQRRKSFSLLELQDSVASTLHAASRKGRKELKPTKNRNIAARAMEDFVEEPNDSNTSLGDSSSSSVITPMKEEENNGECSQPEDIHQMQSAPQSRRGSLEMLCKNFNNVILKRRRTSMGDVIISTDKSSHHHHNYIHVPRRASVASNDRAELEDIENINSPMNSFQFTKRGSMVNPLRNRLEEKKTRIPTSHQGSVTELTIDDLAELKEIEGSGPAKDFHRSVNSVNSMASLPDDLESMMLLDAEQDIRLVN